MMNGMALMIRFCIWFVLDVFIHEISIFCRIKPFSTYSFGILSMFRALEREPGCVDRRFDIHSSINGKK